MALFNFGRKIDLYKGYSLENIPLFSSLTPAELKSIEKKGRIVQYRRGDKVYEEGTPAEGLYAVISGRFRLYRKVRANGGEENINYFYRGDHFGESSILTGKPHSASVDAKSDGLIFKLDKEDFLKLANEIPALSLHLSRSLGHRLAKTEGEEFGREIKIATLYSTSSMESMFHFWLDFAGSVASETKRRVIVIDFVSEQLPLFHEVFQKDSYISYDLARLEVLRDSDIQSSRVAHPKGFYYLHVYADDQDESIEKKIFNFLTFLTFHYDYLMLRLPRNIDHPSFKALKLSDVVYVYCEPETSQLSDCSQAIKEFVQSFGFSKLEIKVIIPSASVKEERDFEKNETILQHRIFSLLPPSSGSQYQTVLRYLAKEWAGTLVGLVLGSGAAYGLAHIGVLRILERENIPVDVIAGSSIGALLGVLWAAGYSADDLHEIAHTLHTKRSGFSHLLGFRDLSVVYRGFFKGNQIVRFLRSYLGDRTFQDLKIPVKVVGTNLFTSEQVIFETGPVVSAVRASISIPGFFRPFFYKANFFIDGGVIDPLPIKVLTQMGVKKIIAVNVLLGPQDRIERNRLLKHVRYQQLRDLAAKNFWKKTLAIISEHLKNRYADNVFNVIMNTILFMEYELSESSAGEADVVIHPVVYDGHWAQFYEPDKFVRMGEEKTLEQLPEIKRLLME
ncbi:MAG: patatin-like phospholipase family protein [Candidatus Omnitrophica bacterium]|nr:patatin-like phospholipase family protein [Candidatus Omnitrophota bacterium]